MHFLTCVLNKHIHGLPCNYWQYADSPLYSRIEPTILDEVPDNETDSDSDNDEPDGEDPYPLEDVILNNE